MIFHFIDNDILFLCSSAKEGEKTAGKGKELVLLWQGEVFPSHLSCGNTAPQAGYFIKIFHQYFGGLLI